MSLRLRPQSRLVPVPVLCESCCEAKASVYDRAALCHSCSSNRATSPISLDAVVPSLPFCASCDNAPATTFCVADSAAYCAACDTRNRELGSRKEGPQQARVSMSDALSVVPMSFVEPGEEVGYGSQGEAVKVEPPRFQLCSAPRKRKSESRKVASQDQFLPVAIPRKSPQRRKRYAIVTESSERDSWLGSDVTSWSAAATAAASAAAAAAAAAAAGEMYLLSAAAEPCEKRIYAPADVANAASAAAAATLKNRPLRDTHMHDPLAASFPSFPHAMGRFGTTFGEDINAHARYEQLVSELGTVVLSGASQHSLSHCLPLDIACASPSPTPHCSPNLAHDPIGCNGDTPGSERLHSALVTSRRARSTPPTLEEDLVTMNRGGGESVRISTGGSTNVSSSTASVAADAGPRATDQDMMGEFPSRSDEVEVGPNNARGQGCYTEADQEVPEFDGFGALDLSQFDR